MVLFHPSHLAAALWHLIPSQAIFTDAWSPVPATMILFVVWDVICNFSSSLQGAGLRGAYPQPRPTESPAGHYDNSPEPAWGGDLVSWATALMANCLQRAIELFDVSFFPFIRLYHSSLFKYGVLLLNSFLSSLNTHRAKFFLHLAVLTMKTKASANVLLNFQKTS